MIAASVVLVVVAALHSYLGERFILMRLFKRDLPKLFGSDAFTKRTLRMAWHATTLAWWGMAVLLVGAARGWPPLETLKWSIVVTASASMLLSAVVVRGRHLSWVAFGAVALLTALWTP